MNGSHQQVRLTVNDRHRFTSSQIRMTGGQLDWKIGQRCLRRKIFDYEQGKLYFVFIAETRGPLIARYQQF